MAFTAEQLLEAAQLLSALDGDGKDDADKAAAEKAAAEKAAAEKAEAEAKAKAEKAAAEAEAKAKAAEEKVKEGEEKTEGQTPDVLQELRDKVAAANLERTKTKLTSAFVSKGFVEEETRAVLDFLDYGTIISSEGEVDEDKISTLVDSISSLSLRKPPRGEKKDYSSNAGGIGKYLTKK